jgi:hypothetical protein
MLILKSLRGYKRVEFQSLLGRFTAKNGIGKLLLKTGFGGLQTYDRTQIQSFTYFDNITEAQTQDFASFWTSWSLGKGVVLLNPIKTLMFLCNQDTFKKIIIELSDGEKLLLAVRVKEDINFIRFLNN